MPKVKLTAKTVMALPAPTLDGKQTLYWDTELRGFGVLCSGTTNGKSYVVQRDVKGRSRRVTIAATNVISIAQAREQAAAILADMYRGTDPRQTARERLTLQAALDSYLNHNKKLRPASVRDYRRSIVHHLSSWLDRPLREITDAMVIEQHSKIAERVQAEGRYSGEATADGVMRTLRAIWAATFDVDMPNPVRALRRRWNNVERRTRVVPTDKLPVFYEAVRSLPSPIAADYLSMALFTGCRRSELAGLEWSEVDLRNRTLRIPAARMKGRRELALPLTDYVHDLLTARLQLGKTKYVFPANSTSGHVEEPKFPLNLVALACGVRVSVHDLRRTFCTIAESCDISPMALKALVGHSNGADVTAGYVQMTVERLREPAQRVCNKMKELCGIV